MDLQPIQVLKGEGEYTVFLVSTYIFDDAVQVANVFRLTGIGVAFCRN